MKLILECYPLLVQIQQLAKKHKRRVYLVGGFLRDLKLKQTNTDFDFAVDQGALLFARIFARQIKGAFVLLDKDHGSARIVKVIDGATHTFDFTEFREKTIRLDLARRDFTINTFCWDLENAIDVSPASAAKDLKLKTIRMVSSKTFCDDPLRILRAFSLHAQTGFKIDRKTLDQIKKDVRLINQSALERVRDELFKILQSARAAKTFALMNKIGLLEMIIPQVTVMFNVKQGGYHHLDVWKHSNEVVLQLERLVAIEQKEDAIRIYLNEIIGGGHTRLSLLKLAALLHDIGKPETLKKQGERLTFHGHERVGKYICRFVAKRLKLSVRERYFIEDVVHMHLRPGYLSNFKIPSDKIVFRYLRDAKTESVSIALLAIADQRSTRGELTTPEKTLHHEEICRRVIAEYFKEQIKPQQKRLLTGFDLIKQLQLQPSSFFADILSAVDEAQALGEITNKQQALELAKKICASSR